MKIRYINVLSIIMFLALTLYTNYAINQEKTIKNLFVTSTSFKTGEMIPDHYTCIGGDHIPQISWSTVPHEAQSFVIICDDPDAPGNTWVHWVLFNIPVHISEVSENKISGIQGLNSWNTNGYKGPCPPVGQKHRYFFRVYALDTILSLGTKATKEEVAQAMKNHVLAEGTIMGYYNTQKK